MLDRIRCWSLHRQHLLSVGNQDDGKVAAGTAVRVLSEIVGVYSAHPTAPLSLLARVPDLTPDAFRALGEALLAEGASDSGRPVSRFSGGS